MSRLLHRLGHSTAAHPWRTISAWLTLSVENPLLWKGLLESLGSDQWRDPGAGRR